jgi:hypothetical protein
MNIFEARQILDAIKDNLSYNLDTINEALELTGDLDIGELERKTSPASYRYGSKEWLDSLCQGKGAGT